MKQLNMLLMVRTKIFPKSQQTPVINALDDLRSSEGPTKIRKEQRCAGFIGSMIAPLEPIAVMGPTTPSSASGTPRPRNCRGSNEARKTMGTPKVRKATTAQGQGQGPENNDDRIMPQVVHTDGIAILKAVESYRLPPETRSKIASMLLRENVELWWQKYLVYKEKSFASRLAWFAWREQIRSLGAENKELWPSPPPELQVPSELAKVRKPLLKSYLLQELKQNARSAPLFS